MNDEIRALSQRMLETAVRVFDYPRTPEQKLNSDAHIALCSPANITALIRGYEGEIERLKKASYEATVSMVLAVHTCAARTAEIASLRDQLAVATKLDYHPNDDLDDPASMEGSFRPEFANQQQRCGKTNRNAGYASCVKPADHLGNHEDACGCWWR